MGGIMCGRNHLWEESHVGGVLSGRNPMWAESCGRNPVWEESCWEEFLDYHQRILDMYLFNEPWMTQFDLSFENFIEITPL